MKRALTPEEEEIEEQKRHRKMLNHALEILTRQFGNKSWCVSLLIKNNDITIVCREEPTFLDCRDQFRKGTIVSCLGAKVHCQIELGV